MKTPPPWPSLALSFRIAAKESGNISEFFTSGVNHDFPQDDIWFSRINDRMNFSLLVFDRLTIHDQNSKWVIQDRLLGLCLSFFLLHNWRRSCLVVGGAMLSGTRLSGSDKVDGVSNLLDNSREAEVPNKDVEKFGIPHRQHSHEILLLTDLSKHHTSMPRSPTSGVLSRPFRRLARWNSRRLKSITSTMSYIRD